MNSLWTNNVDIKEKQKLKGDIETDVLVIGGGMAGILTAYFLSQKGLNYTLVEKGRIGNGITKNTTAKITPMHNLIYADFIEKYGKDFAKQYYNANFEAMQKYKELAKDFEFDLEDAPSYVYTLSNTQKIIREYDALNKLEIKAEVTKHTQLPFEVKSAIKVRDNACFHPLKFIKEISKNLNIFENTFITKVKGNTAYYDRGKIKANKIIIATHFPFIDLHGFYFVKMHQQRSYVIALENAPLIDGMYIDEKEGGLSFRKYKDLLLIGGGSHKTGKEGGNYNAIRKFAKKYYPNSKEKYNFATQDCITLDNVPYIGRYSKSTPNLFVATGFNKWGMTSSMVSAIMLSDLVISNDNKYKQIFDPQRTILHKRLSENVATAVTNLIKPKVPRCRHLGCALSYNKVENTWDCPCHGSRYDEHGNIIDNPTTKNLKSGI
jgi:glycine/D-amino acid oxidase-like deaminating enzyme